MTLDFCEVAAQGAGGLGLAEGLNIPFSGGQGGPVDKGTSLFDTDEFRMFCFKILPCPKAYRHDWTTCHFAHVAERARRRDPRKSKYTDVVCPDMKKFSDESPNLSGSFAVDDGFSSAESNICKGPNVLLRGNSDTSSLHGPNSPSGWKATGRSSSNKSPEDSEDNNTTRAAADLLAKVVCSMGANKLGTERDVAAELHKVLQTERGVTLLQGLVSELETRQSASTGGAQATGGSSSAATAKETSVAYTPVVYGAQDRFLASPANHARSASAGTPETLSPQLSGLTINSGRIIRHTQSSKDHNVLPASSNTLLIPMSASPSVASPRSPPSPELPLFNPSMGAVMGVPCSQPSMQPPMLSSWNSTGSWNLAGPAASHLTAHDPSSNQGSSAYLLADKQLASHGGLNGIPADLLEMYSMQSNLMSLGAQSGHAVSQLQARASEHMMPAEMVGGRHASDMEALLQYFAMQRY